MVIGVWVGDHGGVVVYEYPVRLRIDWVEIPICLSLDGVFGLWGLNIKEARISSVDWSWLAMVDGS